MKKSLTDFTSNQPLLEKIFILASEKKASELIALDVRGLSSITDFFVICHGDSEPHVKAIADNIRKGTPYKPNHIEGYENQNWILIDYFDVIIHVFKNETREYYNIEKLWADAPLKKFNNENT
tara:strand:- start:601 stop:969 length:369 start_codon:yes stop_codon:yes gene_type:complete